MKKRVLVIGIDGGTFDLVLPWVKQGKLPNIKKLLENGTSAMPESTFLPFSAPAWISILTGRNPGSHGVYDFIEREEDSYRRIPALSTEIHVEALWDVLDANKKNYVFLNVPMTYPPPKGKGITISGFPHAENKNDFANPPQILDKYPNYQVVPKTAFTEDNPNFFHEYLEVLRERTRVALDLMGGDWDLFITVYLATDNIAHWYWKYMDERHPFHKHHPVLSNAILRTYEEVDKAIGKMLEKVDDDTLVIVMSDHGFGPVHHGLYLNNLLHEWGYLHFKKTPATRLKRFLHLNGLNLNTLYRIANDLKLTSIGTSATKKTNGATVGFLLTLDDVDWSRTRAYSYGTYGPIYVNLKGREPQGIVFPGKEYEILRNEVISKLSKVKDGGRKVFEKVLKREDAFKGKEGNHAPDIVFRTRNMEYVSNRFFEFASTKPFALPPLLSSGGHRAEAMLIMNGKEVKKQAKLRKTSIVDLMPTILAYLGVPIPKGVEGRVLSEAFVKKLKTTYSKDKRIAKDKHKLTEDEEQIIKDRLTSLGYMG